MCAAAGGSEEIVKLLIDSGAQVDAVRVCLFGIHIIIDFWYCRQCTMCNGEGLAVMRLST